MTYWYAESPSCQHIHWQQKEEEEEEEEHDEEEEEEEEEEQEEEEQNVWRMQSNTMIVSAAKKSAVLSEICWTRFSYSIFNYLSLLKKSLQET